jgi:nucleoside-specific outer membrane channel protein Tsx
MGLSKIKTILCGCILVLSLGAVRAHAKFINWHSTNMQVLKGWNYEVGEEGRTIVTIEHANEWKYGDFFMFVDGTRFDPGKTTAYGEFAPRFSLSKITGKSFSYGVIKDILVSTMFEKSKGKTKAYLYGGAVDLNVPGFKFFRTNFLVRDNPEIQEDDTWQITLAWNSPITIAGQKFLFEGFADFAGEEGARYHENQLIVPRFLWDIGYAMGNKANKLYGGVEYSYWHNKYGIKGETESAPQLQVKWVF